MQHSGVKWGFHLDLDYKALPTASQATCSAGLLTMVLNQYFGPCPSSSPSFIFLCYTTAGLLGYILLGPPLPLMVDIILDQNTFLLFLSWCTKFAWSWLKGKAMIPKGARTFKNCDGGALTFFQSPAEHLWLNTCCAAYLWGLLPFKIIPTF